MHFGTQPVPKRKEGNSSNRKAPFRTAHSRKLVENYWRSVLDSKLDPPLYHTFSDRYRGTQGIPFAARTDCSSVLKGTAKQVDDGQHETVQYYMEQSELAMAAGDLREARRCLHQALTMLQNSDGGLTVEALASSRGQVGEELKRSKHVAEVLRTLAKVALLCNEPAEGLRLLEWSSEADPLTAETYVLRASCYEKLDEHQKAFEEYEKYMKLHEPSIEVLAHCGKCAAEAGNSIAAEHHLRKLLHAAEQLGAGGSVGVSPDGMDAYEMSRFYTSHAYFYLGYVCQAETDKLMDTDESTATLLRMQAREYFALAISNSTYVRTYEANVDHAIESGDYALALHLLRNLQQMEPECADYFLRAAHVCHMTGDTEGEVRALSEALDRHQSLSARRTTLLARGTVYGEMQGALERAIKDYTLVIGLPTDDAKDRCTPIAYLKRAETYRRRFSQSGSSGINKEDQEAALTDYFHFLDELERRSGGAHVDHLADDICHPTYVTDALLILANGAFRKKNYTEATRYFARAMTRGWTPTPQHPCAHTAPEGPVQENLYDQMYISLAHHVVGAYPVGDDMFKVPYEPREWVVPVQQDATRKVKVSEKRDVEKPYFASPSLSYTIVDARYNALRALEPTMFTALEGEFLELWEPYRTEVDRTREDIMTSRGGKRTKRF